MAGNNSCGSRSIAYGNMVHNVLGMSAWLSDGTCAEFGPVSSLTGRAAAIGEFVRELAARHRGAIAERWPRLLRRVGGYNLDIFDSPSERPYTRDGKVNLAHLLVGSEGTLAYTKTLTLQLSPLPLSGSWASSIFRPSVPPCRRRSIWSSSAPTAVELIDRIMIDLGLAKAGFRPLLEQALIGRPAALLLVEFSGDELGSSSRKLDDLAALMGDLGLPGSVVAMTDPGAQKALWDVRKAGLNIMMSLKGDGKPVSFIEDCAVPLEHLADYTDALSEIFEKHGTHGTWYAHASVGTLHVRPILDMRRAGPEGGAVRMRAIAEEPADLVRKFRGAYSGEHGDGLCRGEWIRWQFGPSLVRSVSRHQGIARSDRSVQSGPHHRPAADGRHRAVSLRRLPRRRSPIAPSRSTPELDWSAWNVQNDPLTGELGTGHGRRQHRRIREGRRDVQQQRPLPPVRRRHDVPELSRHAR